jgi:hypothetical protein
VRGWVGARAHLHVCPPSDGGIHAIGPVCTALGARTLLAPHSPLWVFAVWWPFRPEGCRHAPPSAGTSAAAPVVAALVTLLNDARIAAGKSSLGLLNPLLYSIADGDQQAAFNDIKDGHNPGCGLPGFWAGVGWDPVTGVGVYASMSC